MTTMFACPHCGEALTKEERRYVCRKGHSFDIAREGYVNLLPVSRRHSKAPGDDREMVNARTRFLQGGWYEPLRNRLCELVEGVEIPAPALLDAGCGEGYYTAALSETVTRRGGCCCGVDLSKLAVRRAARRCPPETEVAVASVYHLPLPDESADIVVNSFSPLADREFCRVLRPGGFFFYVVPGARHLWELKEILYDAPYENQERVRRYPGFQFLGVEPVETAFTLEQPEDILALFHMTPYTWKTPKDGVERLAGCAELTVTAQFRIHRFRRVPEG